MNDLEAALLAYIGEVSPLHEEVSAGTELLLDGHLDSLAVIEVVQWLEDRAGVSIDPGDVTIENFGSVTAIVTFMERLAS